MFVGPSDVGGSCPAGTYLYASDVEQCCCGGQCCWRNCRWHDPPDNCLPPGATWKFKVDEDSSDKWEHDGEVGYFQAIDIGKKTTNICTLLKTTDLSDNDKTKYYLK